MRLFEIQQHASQEFPAYRQCKDQAECSPPDLRSPFVGATLELSAQTLPVVASQELSLAVNDRILLDGLIDDRIATATPTRDRAEVFELFSFEQLLKFADLTPDEIDTGWVDGENDGGIDGIFTFVNDHLLSDIPVFPWPRTSADLSLWVITCKHHDTFLQAPVDKTIGHSV